MKAPLACAVLCAALSAAAAGCNECDPGARRCSGDVLQVCEPPCSDPGCAAHWGSESCFGACVAEHHVPAFCALDSKPDPGCKGRDSYCAGQSVVSCQADFRVASYACDAETVCVMPDSGGAAMPVTSRVALCAVAAEPDSRCPARQGVAGLCDQNQMLLCDTGFLLSSFECPAACVEVDFSTVCVLSSTPDPRCKPGAPACDGSQLIGCVEGFLESIEDCAFSDLRCVETGNLAKCEP
jgi:hypothetical protein